MKYTGQGNKVFPDGSVTRTVSFLLVLVLIAVFSFSTISHTVKAAPVIISTTLPAAQVNSPYTAVLTAVPLTCPCTWSITGGLLPPGLSLNPASGTITGTPTTSGIYPFFIVVTDTTGPSGPASFSITVSKPPVVINTYSLPQAKEGTAYSAVFSATGGTYPYNWTLASGTLPSGLIIDPSTGAISGTPNKNTAGTYSFTVNASDGSSPPLTTQKSFNIFVDKGTFGATVSISNGLTAGTTKVTVDGQQIAILKGGESANLVVDLGISKTVSVTPIIPHPTEAGVRFRANEESIAVNELNTSANFSYFTEYEIKLDAAPVKLAIPGGSGWYKKDSSFTSTAKTEISGDPGIQYKFNYWLLPSGSQVTSANLSLTVDSAKTIIANYDIFYQLVIQSVNGKTEGAGWYKSGTEASWNVANNQVPMSGFIGFFQGKYKAVNPGGKVIMDAPKTVTVLWEPDYLWPYILIPTVVIFLLAAAYGIYYLFHRNYPKVFQPYSGRPVPQPLPVPPPVAPQHTTVVMIGGDKVDSRTKELPASTKEQLMASFGQLLEKYETEVRSTFTPREPPKIETVTEDKMLSSPTDENTSFIEAEVEQEPYLCNFTSRKLLRTVTGKWRQTNSTTIKLADDTQPRRPDSSKTGLAITWARDIYHEWDITTCSLKKDHSGRHKGSTEIVYSLLNTATEEKTYGPGEQLNPPSPHVTDGMPQIELGEDQIIPAGQLPGEIAK